MASKNSATIDVYVGGMGKPVARLGRASGAVATVYADVPAEIASAELAPEVATLPLGVGHTVASLLAAASAPDAVIATFRGRPGVGLETGLAGYRALGMFAAVVRLDEPDVQSLVAKLVDTARIARAGQLDELRIRVIHSDSGATGTGAAIPLSRAFVRAALARTCATVRVEMMVLGTAAYIGLPACRAELNASSHMAELLGWAAGRDQDPREVRTMLLFELRPGYIQSLREQRTAQFVESLSSAAVSDALDRVGTNAAMASPVGNITLLRPSFLSSADSLIGTVAATYKAEIEDALRERPVAVDREPIVTLQEEPVGSVGLERQLDHIRKSKGVAPVNLLDLAAAPDHRVAAGTVAVRMDGAEMLLGGSSALFDSAEQLPVFRKKIGALRAIVDVLTHATNLARERRGIAEATAQNRRARLDGAIRRLFPRSLVDRIITSFTSTGSLLRAYGTASHEARRASVELIRASARVELFEKVGARVASELELELTRFKSLYTRLDAIPTSSAPFGSISPAPIDDILTELLATADTGAVRRVLSRCVTRLSLVGLGYMLGKPDACAEYIIQELVARYQRGDGECAPDWGGKAVLASKEAFLILPPVSPEARAALELAAKRLSLPLAIHFAETAVAGPPTVIGLHAHRPRDVRDVLSPSLVRGFEEAILDAPAYFSGSGETVLDSITHPLATALCPTRTKADIT